MWLVFVNWRTPARSSSPLRSSSPALISSPASSGKRFSFLAVLVRVMRERLGRSSIDPDLPIDPEPATPAQRLRRSDDLHPSSTWVAGSELRSGRELRWWDTHPTAPSIPAGQRATGQSSRSHPHVGHRIVGPRERPHPTGSRLRGLSSAGRLPARMVSDCTSRRRAPAPWLTRPASTTVAGCPKVRNLRRMPLRLPANSAIASTLASRARSTLPYFKWNRRQSHYSSQVATSLTRADFPPHHLASEHTRTPECA